MNKFLTVYKFEFKNYINKKSAIITFIIYAIIAFGITLYPNIINYFSSKDANIDFKKSGYVIKDINNIEFDKNLLKSAKKYESKEELVKDIKEEKLDEGIFISNTNYEYLLKDVSLTPNKSEFQSVFDNVLKEYIYAQKGLNYKEISELDKSVPKANVVTLSKDSTKRIINTTLIYFLSFILYLMVIMFGSIVATNTAREKTNRAMELLIVTVNPKILIIGKVFAFTSIAIAQISVLIGTFLLGVKINGSKYTDKFSLLLKSLDYKLVLIWFIFAMTGFIMYMFIFASVSSLVNKIEEINTVITIPTLLFVATFFANLYILSQGGEVILAKILSIFPLTSFFIMPTRYGISDVSIITLVLSYLGLLLTTILISLGSVKVYRLATLRYGQKLNFFKILFNK